MKVSLITTSVGGWNKYIVPLIDSVRKYEKDVEIIVVDAGSYYPDTYKDAKILHTPLLNCSEAQNHGMRFSKSDWFLVIDCDTICKGRFIDSFSNFSNDIIYGNQMHEKNRGGGRRDRWNTPYKWLDGWIYAIPRKIYNSIGGFDENFEGSGFEDADYCWRAMDAGYNVDLAMFPFEHLTAGQKKNISDGYSEVRKKNIEYLRKKWKLL